MPIDPFQIVISGLLFASITFLVWSLFRYPLPAEAPVNQQIAAAMGRMRRQTVFEHPVLAPLMSFMLDLAKRLSLPKIRGRVRADLLASGNPHNYGVEEYLAICIGSSLLAGGIGAIFGMLLFGQFNLLIIAFMLAMGFFVPVWTLRSAARTRVMAISKKLPYTLDLIALMMAAGSTFAEAIDTVIRDDPEDDLNQELRIVQSEINFGAKRSAALAGMADRIPLDPLRSIVGAVNQAEDLGTPLSVILKNQSGMLRVHRSVRAEKLSASASLRILIPSMLILFAVVLIVFGPLVVRYFAGELSVN